MIPSRVKVYHYVDYELYFVVLMLGLCCIMGLMSSEI